MLCALGQVFGVWEGEGVLCSHLVGYWIVWGADVVGVFVRVCVPVLVRVCVSTCVVPAVFVRACVHVPICVSAHVWCACGWLPWQVVAPWGSLWAT